ncbi:MAG: ABC transporter transmembrane domain-containing protein, partial [Acidimicrobiales bacterium]|nr:ABC transporter transmembrane domain-containing protein [Acidimicrobiales bacterium]
MSDETSNEQDERDILDAGGTATERRRQGGFGPAGALGMPVEKSAAFGDAIRRLWKLLSTERLRLVVVLVMTLVSVGLVVVGPRLLGQATDVIFSGIVGGEGIDFGDLHRKLLLVAGLYVVSWALSYGQGYILAGVLQRSMYSLRRQVEEKLHRLPLRYVDAQPRGDLLSRVTNDIDNLSQSLQQTISQILVSILMLVGVVV